MTHSQDFPGDPATLAHAIALLISDPQRRAAAEANEFRAANPFGFLVRRPPAPEAKPQTFHS